MFGEPSPPSAWLRAQEETMRADLFRSIGTSAVVYPAAQYPMIAVQRGVPPAGRPQDSARISVRWLARRPGCAGIAIQV